MPTVHQQTLVPYSAEQMYQLVCDSERYPDFLPGCEECRTISRTDEDLIAEMIIRKAGIKQRFTTHNRMDANRFIEIELVEGPFKFLKGYWKFEPLDEYCCQIALRLDFEFANPLVDLAFGQIFTHLTSKLIDAFKKRAREIYV